MHFLTKGLSKAIIVISRLHNKFLNKTEENRTLYVKQKNYRVSLLRKTKKMYYPHLDEKNVTDHWRFWKTVKPILLDKLTHQEKTNLSENREILKTHMETAKVLKTFFSNVVQNLFLYLQILIL